jgi:methylmalonyl-CoA mutase
MDARLVRAAEFAPMDEARWRGLAEKALKGAGFETLVSTTDDGIRYGPLYPRRADAALIARAAGRPWRIAQRIDDPDVARASEQAREDCANGADCIVLVAEGNAGAYGFGLPASGASIGRALTGMGAETAIRLEASAMSARALADALSKDRTGRAVHFGVDPVSAAAATAQGFEMDGQLRAIVEPLEGFSGTVLKADGRIAHNAGATEAQELGFVLAALAGYLRAGEKGGMAPEKVFALTSLGASVDQNQFLSIAKLRALRLLHKRLQTACGVAEPTAADIHAETSFRMLARKDAETNILRNTIAAFAAGVGGADSITVLPHTLSHGLPDGFARRIARNTQVILIHESHLDHVADPCSGSGGIEALTDALAEAAWKEFQAIESEGGIMASLAAGALQRRISAARTARAEAIASSALPIVGTTIFPAKEERPVHVLMPRPQASTQPRGSRRGLVAHPLSEDWKGEAA